MPVDTLKNLVLKFLKGVVNSNSKSKLKLLIKDNHSTFFFEKAKRHVIFLGFTNVVDLDVIKDVYDCEIRPLAEVSHGFHDTPATHVTNVAKPEVEAFEVPSTPTKTCTTHSEEIGEMSKKRNMSLTVMRRLRMFSYCLATSAFLHCYVLFILKRC